LIEPEAAGLPLISLPDPVLANPAPLDFFQLVTNRTSLRRYSRHPFSLTELSFLLWCTQGLKQRHLDLATLRTVPSAGARHPFETLILARNIEQLPGGLYHYLPARQALQLRPGTDSLSTRLAAACLGQQIILDCAVAFIWVAHSYRTTWRYGQRGYRYLHLDAGHIGQNLYLAAEALQGGACTIAAFDDVEINTLLGLDGEQQQVIYLATAGKRENHDRTTTP
jgi:SagB-type dehydrogenase family enzyme